MKAGYLVRGLPGHPLHPPLTDATIGIYTFASAAGVLSALGVSVGEPAHRAVAPVPTREKEAAAGELPDARDERGGLTRY